jgi:hypothetical protein
MKRRHLLQNFFILLWILEKPATEAVVFCAFFVPNKFLPARLSGKR